MRPEDEPRLSAAMAVLAVTLKDKVTPALVDAYASALADLPIESVEAACHDLSGTYKGWHKYPRPGDIREHSEMSLVRRADYTWLEVRKQLKNSAAANHPDPIVERIVSQLGGWFNLGRECTVEQLDWKRKDFVRMYCDDKSDEAARARLESASVRQIEGPGFKADDAQQQLTDG